MTLLVFGSRNWTDREAIREALAPYPPDTLVIHGDNGYDGHGMMLFNRPDEEAVRGADKLAGAAAKSLGMQVRPFPADWRKWGGAAGPLRNTQMLMEGKPDAAICFHEDLAGSRGSADMARKLIAAGVPYRVVVSPRLARLEEGRER